VNATWSDDNNETVISAVDGVGDGVPGIGNPTRDVIR
jgi:hypothetical protein